MLKYRRQSISFVHGFRGLLEGTSPTEDTYVLLSIGITCH